MLDNKDKVSDEDKTLLNEKIAAVKEVLAKADATKEDFEAPSKDLQDTLMQVGQKVYADAGSAPEGEAPTDGEPAEEAKEADDDIQDAEVEK
jgi:molecular chaperone DnaK